MKDKYNNNLSILWNKEYISLMNNFLFNADLVEDSNLLDEVTSHMTSKRFPKVKDAVGTSENHRLKKATNSYKSPKTSSSSGNLHFWKL